MDVELQEVVFLALKHQMGLIRAPIEVHLCGRRQEGRETTTNKRCASAPHMIFF